MVTQQSAIITVKSFIRDLINSGIHLRKVILFGSYAKNQQHEYSDIDVVLIADEFTGIGYIDINLLLKSLRKNFLIQPKTYQTDYYKKGDPFITEIEKNGILINFDEFYIKD